MGRWEGFTVRWYLELLNDEDVIRAAINSFVVALLSALISTCLGALAAYYSARMGSSSLDPVFYVPIVIPEIAEAVSLLLLFYWAGVELGFLTVLIGHTAYNVAYAYVALKPQFELTPRRLEEAAMVLGAKPIHVLLKLLVPLATPGLLASLLITFTMSFDDFVKTAFTTGPGFKTLPLVIWARAARARATPSLNALATIMTLLSLLSAYLYVKHALSVKR